MHIGNFRRKVDYKYETNTDGKCLEAWAAAIRFCDNINDGKATLQYQKNFVSALHNAVELIMKQMMLNNGDHRVAGVRKLKTESDAKLLLDYFKEKDLNIFLFSDK